MRMRVAASLVLAAVAALGVGSGTAFANHGPCMAAGGLTVPQTPVTGTDACVLVSSAGVMVAVDAVNNCSLTGGCTTVGAHANHTGTRRDICVAGTVNNTPLINSCVFSPVTPAAPSLP
jgi:hypothetical protein